MRSVVAHINRKRLRLGNASGRIFNRHGSGILFVVPQIPDKRRPNHGRVGIGAAHRQLINNIRRRIVYGYRRPRDFALIGHRAGSFYGNKVLQRFINRIAAVEIDGSDIRRVFDDIESECLCVRQTESVGHRQLDFVSSCRTEIKDRFGFRGGRRSSVVKVPLVFFIQSIQFVFKSAEPGFRIGFVSRCRRSGRRKPNSRIFVNRKGKLSVAIDLKLGFFRIVAGRNFTEDDQCRLRSVFVFYVKARRNGFTGITVAVIRRYIKHIRLFDGIRLRPFQNNAVVKNDFVFYIDVQFIGKENSSFNRISVTVNLCQFKSQPGNPLTVTGFRKIKRKANRAFFGIAFALRQFGTGCVKTETFKRIFDGQFFAGGYRLPFRIGNNQLENMLTGDGQRQNRKFPVALSIAFSQTLRIRYQQLIVVNGLPLFGRLRSRRTDFNFSGISAVFRRYRQSDDRQMFFTGTETENSG